MGILISIPQGIFLTQGLNLGLIFQAELSGKPELGRGWGGEGVGGWEGFPRGLVVKNLPTMQETWEMCV